MDTKSIRSRVREKLALAFAWCACAFAVTAGQISSADWTKQDDGSWRSGAITDNQASVLVNKALATKSGFVTFAWKSSSESGYDFLRFYVDGEQKGEISGDWDDSWSTVRVAVSGEGAHTLEWVYSKDGSEFDGEDCGWIRNLSFSEGDFQLTLDAQGGELKNASIPAMDGEAIGKLPHPVYPGHAFLGWWTALEGGEKVTAETVFTSAATLYARWKESKYDYDGAEWTELEGGILKTPSITGDETSSLITYVNGEGVLSFDARCSQEDGSLVRGFTVYVDGKIAYNDVGTGWIPLSSEWSQAFKIAIAGAGRHTVKLERYRYVEDDYDDYDDWDDDDGNEALPPVGFVWVRGLNFTEADSWTDAFVSGATAIEGMEGTIEFPAAYMSFPDEEWGGQYNHCYGIAKWTAPKTGYVSFGSGEKYYHRYSYAGVAEVVNGMFKWTDTVSGQIEDYDDNTGINYRYSCLFDKAEEGKTYYLMMWDYIYLDDDNATCGLRWFEAPDFEIGVDAYDAVSYVGIPPAELAIPDGAMYIEEYMFSGATTVESVVIPASVTSVGDHAFGGCTNLATVTFKGDAPELGGYWDEEWDDDEWGWVDVWVPGDLSSSFWNCSPVLTVRVPSFASGWTVGTTTYECYDEDIDSYKEKEIKVEVIPDFKVTLDDDSGAITTNSVPENFKIADAFALPEPAMDGFVFQGWFTAAEGGDLVDGDYVVTSDLALFAHWADAVVAAIDAGAEGATIGDDTTNMVFAVGEKALAKLSALSGNRVGYVLTGWSVAAEGGNLPVDENTVVEAGMTFVAEWTEAVSVTFKKDEADAEPYAAVTLAKGASVGEMMPEDPYDDFVAEDGSCRIFSRWITTMATTVTNIVDEATTNITVSVETNTFDMATRVENHTVPIGDWLRAYEVMFDANGNGDFGEVVEVLEVVKYIGGNKVVSKIKRMATAYKKSVRVVQGETLGELPVLDSIYSPYSFGGWRYDTDKEATPDTVVDKALHIYAWYNVDVRFDANGGTVDSKGYKTLPFEVGKPFGELPVATRNGFEFGGWYYETEEEYWDDDIEDWFYYYIKVPVTTNTIVSSDTTYLRASWKHVLTFDAGEGRFATGDATLTTNCDEYAELTFPADPVRDGYMFAGWCDAEGNLVDERSWNVDREDEWGSLIPRASALFAKWYNCTVIFDALGGVPTAVTNVYVVGETLGELPVATRAGFVLAGWFRNGEAISADTVVETNFTATAKWNKVIVFVDGGETNELTVAEGESVTLPVPDAREGLAFAGWFDADGNRVTELAATIDEASSLVAKWTVTVTFDAGVGAWDGTTSTSNVTIYADEPIGAAMPEAPARDGCEFEGWSDADGKDVTAETVVSASATFTARWSNVTVTFDAKGGDCDVDSRSYMVGELLGELPAATREGLVLAGWFRDVSDGGTPATITPVELSADTVVDGSFEAYAKWNAVVVFVDGNVTNEQEVAENADVALPADPEREGAVFAGWYDANGERVTVDKVTASAAVSLKARWNVVVTFDAGEGSMAVDAGETNLVEKVLFDDEAVGELPVPVRDGYVLIGWFAETEGGEVEIGSDSVIASNTTVRAKWGFNVTFEAGDGAWPAFDELGFEIPGTNVLVVAVGEGEAVGAKMPSDPVSTNAFVGWFTGEGEGKVAFTAESIVTTDVVVRAEWAEGLTVTFDANGGECGEETRTIAKGSVIGELPEATLDDWSLIGWFTAKNGGDAVTPETTPEADVIYYAHWAKGAVVTFDANGGTVEETERVVKRGSAIGELPVPTLAGKSFLGWFTAAEGGDPIDASFSPEANITAYAHWADGWKVTFDANGGTVEETEREVAKGQALGALPVATRKGYQLVGWYTAKTKGKKISAATKPTKNVTYYAVWKVGSWKVSAFADGSGKVTGAKAYAYGKAVTLTAKPAKGWVFVGWEYVVDGDDEGFWPKYEEQRRQPKASFKMIAANVSVMAVFVKKGADAAPVVTLDDDAPWHLDTDGRRIVTVTVDSLTYAAASLKLPAGLKNGMKFAKVPGTDDQWTLKVTNLDKCQPGVYTLKVTAKNRAGKSGAASITVFGPNATAAVDKGALVLGDGISQSTEEAYELFVGMKLDWDSLGIAPAAGWTLSSVSGLPTGLKWNAKTRKVTGVCSKAGVFCTTFAVKKGKTTLKASVTFTVTALPDAVVGTFKGMTATADTGAPDGVTRAVTFTAGSNGKLSAKIGTYSFAATGWTLDADRKFTATLTGKHTVGKGKNKKTYNDTLVVTLDPEAAWNTFQLSGTVTTVLSGTDEVLNPDTFVFAQRNSFATKEDASAVAEALAALGSVNFSVTDAALGADHAFDLVHGDTVAARVTVKADGTATLLGAIGGKMASGSAVVTVDADWNASALFVTSSFTVEIVFTPNLPGGYSSSGKVWMK